MRLYVFCDSCKQEFLQLPREELDRLVKRKIDGLSVFLGHSETFRLNYIGRNSRGESLAIMNWPCRHRGHPLRPHNLNVG